MLANSHQQSQFFSRSCVRENGWRMLKVPITCVDVTGCANIHVLRWGARNLAQISYQDTHVGSCDVRVSTSVNTEAICDLRSRGR